MNEPRDIWSVIQEALHPASGSTAMEVKLTGKTTGAVLTGCGSRLGSIRANDRHPAANQTPYIVPQP